MQVKTLFIPPPVRSDQIYRKSVLEKLDYYREWPCVKVISPTGYGKSVAVSQWLHQSNELSYLWISMKPRLDDLTQLLFHLLNGISVKSPDRHGDLKRIINTSQHQNPESLSALFIDEVSKLPSRLTLILDDYHLISNDDIHAFFKEVLRINFPGLQLIIISRFDPPIYLPGFKLHQKVGEVRISDLMITREELDLLIVHSSYSDKRLTERQIEEFYKFSEGWMLGLILLLKTGADLKEFTGIKPKRSIADITFLREQVIQNIDSSTVRFYEYLSLCDEFSVALLMDLFDFLKISRSISTKFWEDLQRDEFFIIPIDRDQEWYRFHHLFREIVQLHDSVESKQILQFISNWYLENNNYYEAIKYLSRAGQEELAVNLMLENRHYLFDKDEWWVMREWISLITKDNQLNYPKLLLWKLWIYELDWNAKEIENVLRLLQRQERTLSKKELAEYYIHICHHELFTNSAPLVALKYVNKSKALLPTDEVMRSWSLFYEGFIYPMVGKSEEFLVELKEIQSNSDTQSLLMLRSFVAQLFVELLLARFSDAAETSSYFHFIAFKNKNEAIKAWSVYFLCKVSFELFEQTSLKENIDFCLEFETKLNYRALFDICSVSVIYEALVEGGESSNKLQELRQKASQMKLPIFTSMVESTEMRINLIKGNATEALRWARSNFNFGVGAVDPLFASEVPLLTRIRILIVLGNLDEVLRGVKYLDEFEARVSSMETQYHQIDICLLRAQGLKRSGDFDGSIQAINSAVRLHEKSGSVRPFIEMSKVAPQLFGSVDLPISIFSLVEKPQSQLVTSRWNTLGLTNREYEVINLVCHGLRNKEIADRLHVTEATVKSHLNHIFRKLNVKNRASLLIKSRSMDLPG